MRKFWYRLLKRSWGGRDPERAAAVIMSAPSLKRRPVKEHPRERVFLSEPADRSRYANEPICAVSAPIWGSGNPVEPDVSGKAMPDAAIVSRLQDRYWGWLAERQTALGMNWAPKPHGSGDESISFLDGEYRLDRCFEALNKDDRVGDGGKGPEVLLLFAPPDYATGIAPAPAMFMSAFTRREQWLLRGDSGVWPNDYAVKIDEKGCHDDTV